MADDHDGVLRAVAWQDLFPWLRIARVFRMAVGPRALLPAAAGVVAMLLAWSLFTWMFDISPPTAQWLEPAASSPWAAIDASVPNRPPLLEPFVAPQPPAALDPSGAPALLAEGVPRPWYIVNPMTGTWARLSGPVWAAMHLRATASDLLCLVLCGLSSIAIWALVGGAISRMAAVELACDERVGMAAAVRYSAGKWLSYFGAPLLPVLGIVLLAVPIWLLGWLMRADVGLLLVGLVWVVLLALGFVMTLLLAGLLFGWPLMWAAVSTEGTDSFDALSRSYAYVFQRPLHYLFYAAVAALLGWLGWLVVENFASGVVWLTYWAASWSSGAAPIEQILTGQPAPEGIARAGVGLIRFWAGCVKLLAVAYLYSYFWTAATAIYLLLRRDVDATETDEVFLDADQDEPQFELPPLGTDAAGAPEVGGGPPPSP